VGEPVGGLEEAEAARHAQADWLSLALIDARNRTLAWLAAFEASPQGLLQPAGGLPGALWLAGHAGWWQEYWIGRHVQAQRGERCDPRSPRLGALDPAADAVFQSTRRAEAARQTLCLPTPEAVRAYMADTLEAALDLLPHARDQEDALYFYRLALRHEDRTAESMAVLAQAAGAEAGLAAAPWPEAPAARPDRPAIGLAGGRWLLGSAPGGLVPGPERWAHEVTVPPFEIDPQPVSWARYAEFVEDGGYDERRWWSDAGWDWLQTDQRRVPGHVEQLRHGVLLLRRGQVQRAAAGQPAAHVARHEALAWCAWAGRRLPTEPEWESAACRAAGLGFVWGDVYEWVLGSARPWPGHDEPPAELDPMPAPEQGRAVLRGAAWWTPRRLQHPRARRFVDPADESLCCGFRSCAM